MIVFTARTRRNISAQIVRVFRGKHVILHPVDSNNAYHLMAFLIVCVWGITYVSSKILINDGLSPAQIFTIRFFISYVLLLACHHKRLFANSARDEAVMALLGLTGGSLYFLSENTALAYSTASNVSLIVCSCPMGTTLLLALFYKGERLSKLQYAGSALALLGMTVVVLNGHFVLHLSPVGDALALAACLSWSAYSVLLRSCTHKYSSAFITRKVFFYGLLTILPYYIWHPSWPPVATFMRGEVIGHLLFLSVVASFLCYMLWNHCIRRLGVQQASNWIYFNPISTIVSAWILLGERPTVFLYLGAAMILLGMYGADRRR